MKTLDSLQLSIEGQQEIVLRYRCSDSEDYSDIVFRFLSTVLTSGCVFQLLILHKQLGCIH